MIFGTTEGQPWSETLPTARGAAFTGRTFCRFPIPGGSPSVPSVAEIWATADHAVEGHAHDADEMLYVLKGIIEVNGHTLRAGGTVFIPRGDSYRARVVSKEGSHVLRVAFPSAADRAHPPEYDSRIWSGPLTADGFPDLGTAAHPR
jgi:quercetin dioxygenase-like cupin family protein